jgi:hypothetical protein
VIRIPKALPIYDDVISWRISAISSFLDAAPNMQFADSLALHRPMHMDEAMLSGLLAARNIVNTMNGIPERHDLWRLELDQTSDAKNSTIAGVLSPAG